MLLRVIGGVLFPAGGLLGGFVPPELSPAQKRGSGAPQSQGSIEAAGEVELEKSAACVGISGGVLHQHKEYQGHHGTHRREGTQNQLELSGFAGKQQAKEQQRDDAQGNGLKEHGFVSPSGCGLQVSEPGLRRK